jgi:hypothetical protein
MLTTTTPSVSRKVKLVFMGSPGSYIHEPRLRHLIETHFGDITVEDDGIHVRPQ